MVEIKGNFILGRFSVGKLKRKKNNEAMQSKTEYVKKMKVKI